MLAILNSLNAHNSPIFQLILIILASKFMVHRALSDKTYLSLGLLSNGSGFMPANLSGAHFKITWIVLQVTILVQCDTRTR